MSTNKKFRIQNGVDITGEVVVGNQLVITAEGKLVLPAITEAVNEAVASDLAALQAQVDAILGTSPEHLDTLQEIVALFQSEDGDIQTLITNNSTAITQIQQTLASGVATAAQGALADTAAQQADLDAVIAQITNGVATAAQGALADTAVQPEDFFTVADGSTTSYLPDYTSYISSTALSTSSASSHTNWNHARLIKDMSFSENGNVIAVYGSIRNQTANGSYLPGQTNSGGSDQLLNHWVVVWDNQGNYIHSYDMGIVNDTSTYGTGNDDRTHYSADVTDTHIFIGTHYGNIPGAATGSQYAVFEISNPTVVVAQGSANLTSHGQTKIRVIGDKLITSSQGAQLHDGQFVVKEWLTNSTVSSPMALGLTNNWDIDKESGWLYSSPRGSSITGYNFKTNQSAPIISGIQGNYGQVSVGNKYVVVSDNEYNVARDVRVFDVGTINEVASISDPDNSHHWGGGVYTKHKLSTTSTHGDAVVICSYNQSPRSRTHYLYDMSSATPNQHVNSFSGSNKDGANQVVELTGNNKIVKTMDTATQRFGTVLPTIDYMSIAVSTVITPNVDASTIASKVYVDNAVVAADVSGAIATASADATTKADAAQAAAISTASADATVKADQAETDAKAYADQVVAATVDAAPAALDTLNELAAALGDDENFASTVTTSLAAKADTTALDAAVADIATNTTALATKANSADLGQLASFSASTGLSAVTNTLIDWPTSDIAFDSGSTIFTQTASSISSGSFDIVSNSNYIVMCSSGANPDLTIIDITTYSTVATIDLGSYSSSGGYAVPNGLQIDETKVYVTTMLPGGNARTWAWNLSDQTLAWDLGSPSGKNLRMAGISADKSELVMVQSDVGAANEWRTDKALCISTYDGSTTVPEFEIPATTYHPTQDYYVESATKTDSLILIGTPSSELFKNDYNDGIVFVFDSNGTHLQTVGTPNASHPNHPDPTEGKHGDGFGKDIAVWNNKVVILSKDDQTYNSGTSNPNYGDDSIISIWTTSASGITLESSIGLATGTNTGGQIDGNLTIVGNTAYISGYQTNHSTHHWRGGTFIVDLASSSLKTKLLGPDYGPANNLDPDGAAAFFDFPASDRGDLRFSTKSTGSLGDLYVISVLEQSGQDNTLFLTKYSANVTVNKDLSVDDSLFATKAYVDSGVAGVDLSGYSTTTEMNTAIANVTVDLSGYSTTTEMNTAIANVTVDLSGYSTTTEMNSAITTEVANVVDAAPAALDTLNELAAALGDDANFASTVTASIATKADDAATTAALATKADVTALADKASQVDLTAETTRATSAETINNQAIAILQNQVSGISTSSGSTDIKMTAEVDMDSNNIKNANDVYAARGFIDTIEADDLKVQTGTADFEGSTVNFGSATIIGSGFSTASNNAVDNHINVSTANAGEFVKWNGTDYEWTDYVSGRLASDNIELDNGGSFTAGVSATLDFQNGLVKFDGSEVIVDTPTAPTHAANKSYVDGVVAATVDAAPAALDTLNELAAALGDDANFASTVTTSLAAKADDVATTAALATKADASAMTTALATKADQTDLDTLDTFVKGGEVEEGFVSGVPDIGNPSLSTGDFDFSNGTVSSGNIGVKVDRSGGLDVPAFAVTLEVGKTYAISYTGGGYTDQNGNFMPMSYMAAIPASIHPSGGHDFSSAQSNNQMFSVDDDNVVVDASYEARIVWGMVSAQGITGPGQSITSTTGYLTPTVADWHLVFWAQAISQMDVESISIKEYTFGGGSIQLDTTATQVIPAINELHTEIGAIVSTQSGDVSTLTSDIAAETSARTSADTTLQSNIDTEVARASSAEAVNAANIVSETSARTSADAALESDIIGLQNQVGTIISGSPASLDTLVEIVSAFETADASLSGVITANGGRLTTAENNITALEADLTSEETARGAADATLQANIDAEAATRSGLGSQLLGYININGAAITAEETARIAGDASLQSAIDALTSSSNTAISSETTARTSAVSTETSARIAGDASLQSAIDAEETRATNAESGLQTQISNILSNTDATALNSLAEIVTEFQNADSTLTGVVGGHGTRLTDLEGRTTDNIPEGDINKYWTEERVKTALTGGLCINDTKLQATGEIAVDEVEAEQSLRVAEAVVSDDTTKLEGQGGSHYRIDIYDVNGTIVN